MDVFTHQAWVAFWAQLLRPLVLVAIAAALAVPLWLLRRHFPRAAPWLWNRGWFPLGSIGWLLGRAVRRLRFQRASRRALPRATIVRSSSKHG
jgi:hypothetical protein